jgi:exodeoxyribonuclease VII small subunit
MATEPSSPQALDSVAKDKPEADADRQLGFDQVLDRLRQVVARLEQGSLSLEHSLQAFEEGVKLSRRGSVILDAAEQRVELLIRDEEGGERRQPLPVPGVSASGATAGPRVSSQGE